MKKLITLFLLAIASVASAQWTNTTNQFFDSLHMPVCTVTSTQQNPIIVNSYPDGGYFVIWEDDRNFATTNTDIYAQKYDQAGNRLWVQDGVPVVNGPNAQRYTFSSNQDYRNRANAVTDSAGGFYIGYTDDSISSYSWKRIAVQHMRSNGIPVFPGAGYIVAQTPPGQGDTYSSPFLIADGNKGFFISFIRSIGNDYVFVYSYRDENGTMVFYGGDKVNENAIQRSTIAPCGIRTYIEYPGTNVLDYNIWPDGQRGCNVIMYMNGNTGEQYKMIAYNHVWRAKKDARVRTYYRNNTGVACPRITNYVKDKVYRLYSIATDFIDVACGTPTVVYGYTNFRLLSNGYQLIDQGGYDYNYPKGTTLSTLGNINVDFIAVTKRTYINNTLSNFTVQGYAYKAERFDSIPFQRTTYSNPDIGYNPSPPTSDNKLGYFRDTILASSNYYPDFSLAGGGTGVGGNHIYAGALMSTSGDRLVRLQHLTVDRKSSDSFAIVLQTSTKYGEIIGREVSTGFSGSNISYDFPLVTVNSAGNALFYIREYYRAARVSPIINGAELAWGAMGKPISTGVYNNSYYNLEQPFAALDPSNGTGLITWRDNKNIPGGTGENIFMRHLDNLNAFNYLPPIKPAKLVPNPYGPTLSNPAVLVGSSKVYSTIEVYDPYGAYPGTSPAVDILDNYNLGVVQVNVYQNNGVIRTYNNHPYLDRNLTIKSENNPTGANIKLLLYFPFADFNALKAADNSISNPGNLVIIRQPNNTITTPSGYIPITGEEVISPITWDSVPGGYLLKIAVTGFGNFFIQKAGVASLCNGGNTSITSSITGINYQWQLNTGSGFTNITDNSNYSGTNTVSLQLTNLPSSWYGYQYRCVVDGNNSYPVALQFVDTWTGAVNNTWENPGNWSCGMIPDANSDVVINSGTITVNSNRTCRSLKLGVGVTITVTSGFTLTVTH